MNREKVPSVAVVGTGTIGSMTLWRLAELGIEATGFDTYAPGHDRGAAGGESRIFRVAYKEGAEYVPLLQHARGQWEKLNRTTPHSIFHQSGFVTVGPEEDPQIQATRSAADQYQLEYELFDDETAAERVSEHPLRPGEIMLYDPNGGLILPELAVLAAANRAKALGAVVRPYTRIHDITDHGDHAIVTSGTGSERFDQVVIAAGPWVRELPPLKSLPLQPKEIVATWFPRRSPDLFVVGRTPPAVRVGTPGFSCFPAVDGNNVKVVAHGAFQDIESPDRLNRGGTAEQAKRASRFVEEVLPGVYPQPVRAATYSDAYTPDHHPVLGRLTSGSAIIVAAGFSGHGFKLSPTFGDVLASLVMGEDLFDIEFMNPRRFEASPAQGTTKEEG